MNLLEFGEVLGSALGVGTFAGGLLATLITLGATFIIIVGGTRKIPPTLWSTIICFSILGFCVAVQWFPVWFFALIIIFVALAFGKQILGTLQGRFG